jgi:SAM-dependent methyltransferase
MSSFVAARGTSLTQSDANAGHYSATSTPIVSSNSWQPEGANLERAQLTAYLQNTAATDTIQQAMDRAVAAMRLSPGDRVLDVGCGTGVFLPRLAEAVGADGTVVALDHAPGFLDDARTVMEALRLPTRIDYVEGDALELPFPDASFDSAHTERVLIHLSDPDRGLRELRRVVKSGGWVVCVEPDLAGWRIDHAQPELARLLVAGFTETIRFPAMGLELNRRMAEAGLTERVISTLTEVERDLPEDVEAVLRAGADRLVAEGRIDGRSIHGALDWLVGQSGAGTYCSYTSMFIVAGRVP